VGECNNYLKARFEDEPAARDARPRLAALLAEGERAYRFWQDSRQADEPEVSVPNFPLTTDYLGELAGVEDWDDGLVGHLGSLVDPVPRPQTPSAQLTQEDDVLLLQLNMIWHFSDLGLLERFCFLVLDAVAVGSVSDETVEDLFTEQTGREMEPGFDPFDAIWV
jgi:hypothetical protein